MLVAGSLVNSWCLDVCEEQEDGARLAHPADCSRFIQCHGGQTVSIRYCPFGLHYNRYETICDFKFRAGCDFSYALQLVGYDNANKVDCEACRAKCYNGGSPGNELGLIRPPDGQNQDKPLSFEQQPAIPCLTAPTPKPTPSKASTTPCVTSTPSKPTAPTPCPIKPSTPPSGSEGGNDNPKHLPPVTGSSGVKCADPGICKGQRDGTLFADKLSDGFIVCQCQCEIKMPCPVGLVFHKSSQACDWPQS